MRVYAHALPSEESDLAFADFGAENGAKRLYPAPALEVIAQDNNAPAASERRRYGILERETGLEPATLSLGSYLHNCRFRRFFNDLANPRSGQPLPGADWLGHIGT